MRCGWIEKMEALCGGGYPYFMSFKGLLVQVLQSLPSCPPEEVPAYPGHGASQEVMSWLVPSSFVSMEFSQPELQLLLPPFLQARTG